jgi:hypothetical protein
MASNQIIIQNKNHLKINETEQKILNFVKENFEVPPKDIVEFLEISATATYKYLKKLVELRLLEKLGKSPKVFYRITNSFEPFFDPIFSNYIRKVLVPKIENGVSDNELISFIKYGSSKFKNGLAITEYDYIEKFLKDYSDKIVKEDELLDFLYHLEYLALKDYINITPEGEIQTGFVAFNNWCIKRKLQPSKTLLSYMNIQEKYTRFKTKDGQFIVATEKFKQTFGKDTMLDEVLYCDFYSIEIFGKTKLGSLLLHGKQTQNIKIINQVCTQVKDRILKYIAENNIDAVAFIPPTIDRKPQFMDEFKKSLNLSVPIIKLEKVVNDIAIQQKTLKSSQERIENTRNTIFVDEKRQFKNILLLDDAVGSGSTFNEIARKIRLKKLVTGKISAIAIVGSANGIVDKSSKFEVLNEV